MFTEDEALEIRALLKAHDNRILEAEEGERVVKLKNAKDWFKTVKPRKPKTRKEALEIFNSLKDLYQAQTIPERMNEVSSAMNDVNEDFKTLKKQGAT